MQGDRILRIAILIARLRESNNCHHAHRIRLAQRIVDATNIFIAEEVRRANNKKPTDPNYMSWAKIGQAVGLSRNAAYTRYGDKKQNETSHRK